jgi:saccharopine dehydrogenase (NAD+, L-lysine-forming)
MTKKWRGKGVFNLEQLDPDPFMRDMDKYGLPWQVEEYKDELIKDF